MTDLNQSSGTAADHAADVAKVVELARGNPMTMLTTIDGTGRLVSRPMAMQEIADDGGRLWFFADRTAPVASQAGGSQRVNVAFSSRSSWVSVAGTSAVVDDRAKIEQLWNSAAEAWFPDGPDSPDLVLLRVDADTAEYWDTPGGRVATAISFVKAKVTGEPYEGPDNEVVDLG